MAREPVPGTRDAAAFRECTRDPIFLFQRRRWIVTGAPEGYEFDCDGECVKWTDCDGNGMEEPSILSPKDLAQNTHDGCGWDVPCAIETWETESVWLSREEAEAYGRRRSYNYRDGWRVYCVCAEGQLGQALKVHGEAFWPNVQRVVPHGA